jgi:flavin-dependent dehydrogenase
METNSYEYDCAIIGGGLSGLCLAIQLAGQGLNVIVFEKNGFPAHKVCGEYISMESHDFLCGLGLPLKDMNLPYIRQLGISSEQGFMLNAPLALGGFGISRFTLDDELYKLAVNKGITVVEQCKVQKTVHNPGEQHTQIETSKGMFKAKLVCGSYGKYTPAFIQEHKDYATVKNSINYIGVKYHIKTDLPHDRIELHNFKNGYCGISKVDKDWYCLCYLSDARNLQENGNSIQQMEEQVLYKNPFLKTYFTTAEFVNRQPLVISNVQFSKKQAVTDHMLLLGDAAGSISPLCGNGMSMGMRASKILATEIGFYFKQHHSEQELISNYIKAWNKAFNTRIKTGYYLQNLFGKRTTTQLALKTLKVFPGLTKKIISLTHGQPF